MVLGSFLFSGPAPSEYLVYCLSLQAPFGTRRSFALFGVTASKMALGLSEVIPNLWCDSSWLVRVPLLRPIPMYSFDIFGAPPNNSLQRTAGLRPSAAELMIR